MDLAEIVRLSNTYGSDPELVLAGGGNTSVKDDSTLYVKCSGTQLATIDEAGFVPVDREKLAETMKKDYPADDAGREAAFLADVMAARTIPGETRRPSVEALLHSLFPQRYVLHLHPALVNGLTCGAEGESRARAVFGDEIIWIEAIRPGCVLAKRASDAMAAYRAATGRDAGVVLLQNHGIFVAADSAAEVGAIFDGVMDRLRAEISRSPDFTPEKAPDPAGSRLIRGATGAAAVRFDGAREILRFAGSKAAAAPLMRPFTPDHIVYCGAWPTYLERLEDIRDTTLGGKIVLVRDVGAFALGGTEREAETAALLFRDAVKIAVYAESFGGPLPMTDELTAFILNWEAESYRKKKN